MGFFIEETNKRTDLSSCELNQQRGESMMKNQKLKLRSFVTIAMLSSVSFILMLIKFPLPGLPDFLKIDFSDVPSIIAIITMGPVAGILVELVKNILDWIYSGAPTGVPVGHMANFATGILFIFPTYYIYKKFPTIKGLITGLSVSTVVMALGMSLLNYLVFLPMYTYFLGWGNFDMKATVVLGILPFNLIKGIMLVVVVTLLFRTMKVWIENQRVQYSRPVVPTIIGAQHKLQSQASVTINHDSYNGKTQRNSRK